MVSAQPIDYDNDEGDVDWCGPDCPYCNGEDWSDLAYGEDNAYL